ncbi:tumor necrosis factor receptor superfamily member 14 isoform X2 [Erinaceus europaeus]|uniref:Tumor necrosis factor receptor superfamily member 14 isoform X2 n=1 Tax=Erinaceus europaeus TaxID=9365 RepID=A0ABM3Y498_ERIEU|nr:tumor necrosis factor receptor superfamily member 14 isoform X2 [Erinaceus europaeus]
MRGLEETQRLSWRLGTPHWSPVPKAAALRLVLHLLLLGAPHSLLATTLCKEEEYPVGGECCPKCSPGYRVKEHCGEFTGTVCAPCAPRTYTSHLNGLSECLKCQECEPAMGLVTRQKCSSTENAVCGCKQGHFCSIKDEDNCVKCQLHMACSPGQRMQQRGTEWEDTVCVGCSFGTFSPNGSLEECQPWTECIGTFQWKSKPGTNSTDVTCSSWGLLLFTLGGMFVLIIIVAVICCYKGWKCSSGRPSLEVCHCRKTHHRKRNSPNVEGDYSATQPLQGVTTVAEKETTPEALDQRPRDAEV